MQLHPPTSPRSKYVETSEPKSSHLSAHREYYPQTKPRNIRTWQVQVGPTSRARATRPPAPRAISSTLHLHPSPPPPTTHSTRLLPHIHPSISSLISGFLPPRLISEKQPLQNGGPPPDSPHPRPPPAILPAQNRSHPRPRRAAAG